MKKKSLVLVGVMIILAGVIWALSQPAVEQEVVNAPWQIQAGDEARTKVFSLTVGQDTLSQVVNSLRKVPELAIFQHPDGSRILEAYFSSVRLGLLRADVAAEVDINGVDLSGYANFDKPGKPVPSGARKYRLSKTGIIEANQLRVWKIAYLPSTNYEADQLLKFFGDPDSVKTVSEQVEYWLYQQRGLVIVYDKEGREIFYYSARREFERLLASLPKSSGADG